jgi:hypothetical protein
MKKEMIVVTSYVTITSHNPRQSESTT